MDNITRWCVYEALDECGIYKDPQLEKQLLAHAAKLRAQKQFANLNGAVYENFCYRLIAFIEQQKKGTP